MMFGSLILVAVVSFIVTIISTMQMRPILEASGMLGIDQQKATKPRLATSGGICVLGGFVAGVMAWVALNTFYLKTGFNMTLVFASVVSVLLGALIGILDDLHIRKELIKTESDNRDYRVGIKQWKKVALSFAIAVPLMAVSAGQTTMHLPFIGPINLGILFPLLVVPIAVVCVTNSYNMLAGMNGMEAGLGIVSNLALAIFSFLYGNEEASIISAAIAFSLLAFLKWNWYPAKILPGDSLTYMVGAAFVSAVIIGNVEKFGVIIFLPWIIEAFLKMRGGFKVSSLGILQNDNTLKSKYNKVYSLTHFVMSRWKFKEYQITATIIGFEILVCIFAFIFIAP